jgi:hypothetical protein
MKVHANHAAPGSWTISANSNNPPYYGLDIIYIDLTTWETGIKSLPYGAVVMSNGILTDATQIERFADADGKFIVHGEPGATGGSSAPQSHRIQGTTGSGGVSGSPGNTLYTQQLVRYYVHNHTIDLYSASDYTEPRNLVTRLYKTLVDTSRTLAGIVVFVDGAVGANWELLTSWAGGNLKSGNAGPTLSGTDTHQQTFSGNTNGYAAAGTVMMLDPYPDYWDGTWQNHYHPVSGVLGVDSHVPLSRQIIPARLLNTLYRPKARGPMMIGLTW